MSERGKKPEAWDVDSYGSELDPSDSASSHANPNRRYRVASKSLNNKQSQAPRGRAEPPKPPPPVGSAYGPQNMQRPAGSVYPQASSYYGGGGHYPFNLQPLHGGEMVPYYGGGTNPFAHTMYGGSYYARQPPQHWQYPYPPPPLPGLEGNALPNRSNKLSEPSRPSTKAVDAVWNASSQRDVTVHFELDVEEDLDQKIEELSGLIRMGRFHQANEYFRENLESHLHQLPVVLEYAGMLLAQGKFGLIFESFNDDEITRSCQAAIEDKSIVAEEVCLLLTLHLARSYSDPNLSGAVEAVKIAVRYLYERQRALNESVAPTELQIVFRYLKLTAYIRANSSLAREPDPGLGSIWERYSGLYRDLHVQGRLWELRDLFVSFVDAFGPIQASTCLLGEDLLASGVNLLLHDWDTKGDHGLTGDLSACLLDILVCLGKGVVGMLDKDGGLIELTNFVFARARAVAGSMKERNVQSIKSRPYLEWILAESQRVRALASFQTPGKAETTALLSQQSFQGHPGRTVWPSVLPIYAPSASETPGWPARQGTSESSQPDGMLTIVLKAAEELGDLATKAACIRELICQSQDPEDLFTNLENLHLLDMGNKLGALQTRLSKYLLAVDDKSRQALRKETQELDPRLLLWHNFDHPAVEWCHRRVQHALGLSAGVSSNNGQNEDGLANALIPRLPPGFLSKSGIRDAVAPGGFLDVPRLAFVKSAGAPRGSTNTALDPGLSLSKDDESEEESEKEESLPARKANLDSRRHRSGKGHEQKRPTEVEEEEDVRRQFRALYQEMRAERDKLLQRLEEQQKERDKAQSDAEEAAIRRLEEQQKEREKVRRDAGEATFQRFEDMRKAEEEATVRIEEAKAEAVRMTTARLDAQYKAEEERRKLFEESIHRAERNAREKREEEFKAAEERRKTQEEALRRVEREARDRLGIELKAAKEREQAEREARRLVESRAQDQIEAMLKAEAAAAEERKREDAVRWKEVEEKIRMRVEAEAKAKIEQEFKLAEQREREKEEERAAMRAEFEAQIKARELAEAAARRQAADWEEIAWRHIDPVEEVGMGVEKKRALSYLELKTLEARAKLDAERKAFQEDMAETATETSSEMEAQTTTDSDTSGLGTSAETDSETDGPELDVWQYLEESPQVD